MTTTDETNEQTHGATIAETIDALARPPEHEDTLADAALRVVDFSALTFDRTRNVRSRYDGDAAESLKATIRVDGILQNLLVVELPDGRYDGVAGFRRYMATESLLYDLAAEGDVVLMQQRRRMPIKVLTPDQAERARELNLIENLQREAVDPVDEAHGYECLLSELDDHGGRKYTYESLAVVLGVPKKGPDYIRKRINLLAAPDFLLDAIRELGMSPRIGELVGKIPNKKDREEMAKRAIKHPTLGIPMTLDQVRQMIAAEFTITLDGCEWDPAEPHVLDDNTRKMLGFYGAPADENDGSCLNCRHRTGRDPLLKDELRSASRTGALGEGESKRGSSAGIDPNICQHPRCYQLKAEESWRTVERLAEAQGNRVMAKDQAKRLWESGSFQGPLAGQYIRKDYRPDYDCTGHFAEESLPTWDELLRGENVSWLIVRNPNKRGSVYLLEKADAIALVEAKCLREGRPNPLANRPGQRGAASPAATVFADLDEDDEDAPTVARGGPGQANGGPSMADTAARRARHGQRVRTWQRLLMQAIEDKLRQEPAKVIAGEVWEPLVMWSLDLALQLPHEYLPPLLGQDWPENMRADDRAQAVIAAYSADDSPSNQLRWVIMILLASEMSNWDGADMEASETCRAIAQALAVDLPRLRELARESVPEPGGQPSAEPWGYYCDDCHAVCEVEGHEIARVEKLAPGAFVCDACCVNEPESWPRADGACDYEGWVEDDRPITAVAAEKLAWAALTIPEKTFLDALLDAEIEATAPNDAGVFEGCLTRRLSFGKRDHIEVSLAVDELGGWYCGFGYQWGTAGGGTLPNKDVFGDQLEAIEGSLRLIEGSLNHSNETKRTLKPRESIGRLMAVVRALLANA